MNRMVRSRLAVIALLALIANILAAPLSTTAVAAELTPSVIVNGQLLETDVAPVVENERLLVPARAVFKALGAVMDWDQEQQKITATRGNDIIVLWIGQTRALKNGESLTLEVTPQVVNERVLVPLRFVADALGAEVSWDPAAMQAHIALGAPPAPDLEIVPEPPAEDRVFEQVGIYGPESDNPNTSDEGSEAGLETIPGNAVVKAPGVTLQNMLIQGDLIIAAEVGGGDVYLNNITVQGRTFIRGGGADSIHIDGGQYAVVVIEQTPSGQVRIVAVNSAGIPVVVTENANGMEIILEGSFDVVAINASGVRLVILGNSSVSQLSVAPGLTNVGLQLSTGSTIERMTLESPVEVTGEGQVENASGTQTGQSTFSNPPVVIIPTPAPQDYQVTVEPVTGGSATVSVDNSSAGAGELITVSIAGIENGKAFKSITVSDSSGAPVNVITVAAGSNYTFIMPAAEVRVSVVLEDTTIIYTPPVPDYHQVLIAPVVGGSATLTVDKNQAQKGENVTVTISGIESSLKFSALEVTDASGHPVATSVQIEGAEYGFIMPASDVTVSLSLVPLPVNIEIIQLPTYNINVAPVQGGPAAVAPDTNQAREGQKVTVTIGNIPASHWVQSFTVTAADGSSINTEYAGYLTYSFIMPARDVTIHNTLCPIEIIIIEAMYPVNILPAAGDSSVTVAADRGFATAGQLVTVTVDNIPANKRFDSFIVERTDLVNISSDGSPVYTQVPVTEVTPFQILIIGNEQQGQNQPSPSTRVFQFTMPPAPVNVRAAISGPYYAISTGVDYPTNLNATLTADKSQAAPGEIVQVVATIPFANQGYYFNVNGLMHRGMLFVKSSGDSYTWSMVMPDSAVHIDLHVIVRSQRRTD